MRKMILAVTPEQRKAALNALLPFQRSDFEGIFRAMDGDCSASTVVIQMPSLAKFESNQILIKSTSSGLPVTIRLLDPPLHEFLPEGQLEDMVGELAAETGLSEDEVLSKVEKLSEVNPMLGLRGCRLMLFIVP